MSELLKRLLQRLLGRAVAYLCPGIDEEDPASDDPVDDGDDPALDDDDGDDPALELSADDPAPDDDLEPAPRQMTRGQRAIVELRERAKTAEKAAKEAKEALDADRAQRNQRPDPTLAEEEAKLRDANTSELEKWQIQSNRALRQSQAQSQQALARAEDLSDKATYTQKSVKNPIYEKYAERVEAKLVKARAAGLNPAREVILKLEIADDMLAGKFTAKAASTGTKTIARGKSPGARSDTPVRGRMSDREKRAARLENTQI